jgi:hypothetical protein
MIGPLGSRFLGKLGGASRRVSSVVILPQVDAGSDAKRPRVNDRSGDTQRRMILELACHASWPVPHATCA